MNMRYFFDVEFFWGEPLQKKQAIKMSMAGVDPVEARKELDVMKMM